MQPVVRVVDSEALHVYTNIDATTNRCADDMVDSGKKRQVRTLQLGERHSWAVGICDLQANL